jgi:uncharacterized protein YjlB
MIREGTMGRDDTKYAKSSKVSQHGGTGGGWFLGFVGTLVYFLHYHSGSFELVMIAIFKAIFWPAYLVYYLLRFMNI